MNKFSIHFCTAFALCLAFGAHAFAAPSVKRLGGMNTYSGTANAVSAKTGTVPNAGARTASAKTVGRMVAAKPVVANKAAAGDTNANTANTARLSVGKYLHAAGVNAGVIKPATTVAPTTTAVGELLDNYYTKDEINSNYYTIQNIDDKLDNHYTKDEMDSKLTDYYTKAEIDAKIPEIPDGLTDVVTVFDDSIFE